MTLNYINKNIELLKEDLACTNKIIESIENNTGILEYREEKLNSALKLKAEIEHRVQGLENEKRTLRLQAMKASLQDCINEAKTDDELATFTAMLAKFNTLHPEI